MRERNVELLIANKSSEAKSSSKSGKSKGFGPEQHEDQHNRKFIDQINEISSSKEVSNSIQSKQKISSNGADQRYK